jgi:hypothetical protein
MLRQLRFSWNDAWSGWHLRQSARLVEEHKGERGLSWEIQAHIEAGGFDEADRLLRVSSKLIDKVELHNLHASMHNQRMRDLIES